MVLQANQPPTAGMMTQFGELVLITTSYSLFANTKSELRLHQIQPCDPARPGYAQGRTGSMLAHLVYQPDSDRKLDLLPNDVPLSPAIDLALFKSERPTFSHMGAGHEGKRLAVSARAVEQQQQQQQQRESGLLKVIATLRDEVGEDYRWLEDELKDLPRSCEKDHLFAKPIVGYHGPSSKRGAGGDSESQQEPHAKSRGCEQRKIGEASKLSLKGKDISFLTQQKPALPPPYCPL